MAYYKFTQLRKADYFNHWHHKTLEDMFGKNTFGKGAYFSADQNHLKSDFLTNPKGSVIIN